MTAVAVAVGGGSGAQQAVAFPVLGTRVINVSGLSPELPALSRADARLDRAHPIETPFGTGYVAATAGGRGLCLVIPDTVPGYGEACSSTEQAAAQGLDASFIAPPGGHAVSELVIVLPSGSAAPSVSYADGTESTMPVVDGVAAATFEKDARVRLNLPHGQRVITVPAHETQTGWGLSCPDGHLVPIPGNLPVTRATQAKYCPARYMVPRHRPIPKPRIDGPPTR